MKEDNINNNNCDDEIYVSDLKRGDFQGFPAKRSIAERRGFNSNPTRINTALFHTAHPTSTPPLGSPVAQSPCLTIPPGISPTALLDSPIMLLNSQALPSPTTGSFLTLPAFTSELGNMDVATASFKLKPQYANLDPNCSSAYLASLNQVPFFIVCYRLDITSFES
ncbi:hypothetical protein SESBI_00142 [Sesbania bispinosa]|nr:hypothetical protein SESBI_00142 [Sesbania bispinosa]